MCACVKASVILKCESNQYGEEREHYICLWILMYAILAVLYRKKIAYKVCGLPNYQIWSWEQSCIPPPASHGEKGLNQV